jgi:hypothetical protein
MPITYMGLFYAPDRLNACKDTTTPPILEPPSWHDIDGTPLPIPTPLLVAINGGGVLWNC